MELHSVREIKAAIGERALAEPRKAAKMAPGRLAYRALPPVALYKTVALGISRAGRRDYKLAIRLQRTADQAHPSVAQIIRMAHGEVDLRYTGRVVKEAARSGLRDRLRPLRMGTSVGHSAITAGTLGAFVELANGATAMLSNNHVLANENLAKIGDPILQPGPFDGGTAVDQVARLSAFARLSRRRRNSIDAAVAKIEDGVELSFRNIPGIGRLIGQGEMPQIADLVRKTGRTTGTREGRVTAIEIDNLVVGYDIGDIIFDGQIEIEGTGNRGFSDGGDSGSLIVDGGRQAVALLFAGSNQGGSNGRGLTYANAIDVVLSKLSVRLLP
jgi:hypothetical protein